MRPRFVTALYYRNTIPKQRTCRPDGTLNNIVLIFLPTLNAYGIKKHSIPAP